MKPVCELYAQRKTRELEQQLAQARAEAEHFAELGQESDMQSAAASEVVDALREENAAMRALLMLARGLIINDSKPAAVSMWVSKHDAFLAEHPQEAINDQPV